MRAYVVNIIGLSKKAHTFDFQLKERFFEEYGKELVSSGDFNANVILDKRETFIEADFDISGTAKLICDRSLEPFDHPIALKKKIVFKYGEEPQEISDEIIIITRDQDSIDLGQFMYEFIALAIPIRKIHPDLRSADNDSDEERIIYSTASDEEEKEPDPDPRWEKLKKLK